MGQHNGFNANTGVSHYGGPIRAFHRGNHTNYALQCTEGQDHRRSDEPSNDYDPPSPQQKTGLARVWSMIWQPKADPNLEMVKKAVQNISERL